MEKRSSGDLLLEDLAQTIERTISRFGGRDHCKVWMKFTCPNCGSRQTMDEPYTVFRHGTCQECGVTSRLERGGFLLAIGQVT